MKIRNLNFYGFGEQDYMQPLSHCHNIILPDYKVSVSQDRDNIITVEDDNSLLAKIGLKLEGQTLTLIDAARDNYELASVELPNMNAITNLDYNNETKEIVLSFKTITGEEEQLNINVSDLVDVYEAGKGLEKVDNGSGHTFNVKVSDNGYLGFDEDEALIINPSGLTTDAELEKIVDTIQDILDKKVDSEDYNSFSGETQSKLEELEEKKANKSDLDTWSGETSSKVDEVEKSLNELSGNTETKIEELEKLSGETISKIEELEKSLDTFSGDTETKLDEVEKSLNDFSGNTESKLEKLEKKKANKEALEKLDTDTQTKLNTIDANIGANETRIKTNAAEIKRVEGRVEGVKGIALKNRTDITKLNEDLAKEVKTRKENFETLTEEKLGVDNAKLIYHTIEDANKMKTKISVNEQEIAKKANSDDINDALGKKLDSSLFTPVATDVETLKSRMTKAEGDILNKVNTSNLEDLVNGYTSNLASRKWVSDQGYQTSGDVKVALNPYATIESLKNVAFSGKYDDLTGKPDYTTLSEKVEGLGNEVSKKASEKFVNDQLDAKTKNMAIINDSNIKVTYNQTEINNRISSAKTESLSYTSKKLKDTNDALHTLTTDYHRNAHNEEGTGTFDVLNKDYHNLIKGCDENDIIMEGLLLRIVNALDELGKDVKK